MYHIWKSVSDKVFKKTGKRYSNSYLAEIYRGEKQSKKVKEIIIKIMGVPHVPAERGEG